jgi:uncharacterized protein YdaU (DUF1376 family)
MSNRAWMPLDIDDYIRDTDHLSAAEHGAYLLLIMKYWRDGGLPGDEGLIRRYAKLSPEQWAESRCVIVAFFEEGWRHKRIDAELQKAADIIEKRKAAGKSTQFSGKRSANAEQMPEQMQNKSTAPLTSNLSNSDANASSYSPEPEKSAPVAMVSPTVIELPCADGSGFAITESDVAEWSAAFPAVDIRQQLAAARSWLNANPTRRKTRRGMRKFAVAWLDRRQNSGGASYQSRSPPPRRSEGVVEAAMRILGSETSDGFDSIFGNHGNDKFIPATGSGQQGSAAEDVQGGASGSIITIDH